MNKKLITLVAIVVSLNYSLIAYATSLSSTRISLGIGDITTITAWDSSGGTWTSDKPNVASVTGGRVEGISVGNAIITFKSNEGDNLDCKVTVTDKKAIRIETEGEYIVSSSNKEGLLNIIPPGNYIVKGSRGRFGNYTVQSSKSSTGIKYNRTLLNNDIIAVEDGDKVILRGCYMSKLESTALNTCGSGTFIVGQHINAGKYVVETDNCMTGQFILCNGLDTEDVLEAYDIKQSTPYEIEITDGQVIILSGCKLVG